VSQRVTADDRVSGRAALTVAKQKARTGAFRLNAGSKRDISTFHFRTKNCAFGIESHDNHVLR
jgi:hypothetical protein